MKNCGRCGRRDGCTRPCREVEARLPKELTGKNTRREVAVSPAGFEAAADAYSFCMWRGEVSASAGPGIDLSCLTAKEKSALMLLASGISQRAAARRLRIHLKSFQKRVRSARAKLRGRRYAHLVRGIGPAEYTDKGDG